MPTLDWTLFLIFEVNYCSVFFKPGSHFCKLLVWYILLPDPAWNPCQNKASWLVVVFGLGDNSDGCSFTTHCAAGLSLDAGVRPLATGEMSCLLPFPYTPKPNEQHGVCPPAFTLSSLQSVSSSIGLLPSWLHHSSVLWFLSSLSPTSLFAPPSIDPSLKPTIYLNLISWSLCSQTQCFPLCGLTTQWLADNDLAWPQRLRSELSLSHGIYTWAHKWWVPQKGMRMHPTQPHMHVDIMCASTHSHVQTSMAFHALLIQDWLIYIFWLWQRVWPQLTIVFIIN